ncbi:regulatory protein RecX [Phocaeicola oris]|uniref:regulatory protein RecX n=1 Tax=Phocaeicola oris TaxID=2896850 RepID=UPI00234F8ABD|nr:regulatory protein RecX [Phocaeicola oris]MCE2617264.1 RecX family transcriptional regulator [Phocaeicola oris]
MKEEMSIEDVIRNKAEAYCASVEHCVSEVEAKLSLWGTTSEVSEKVITHLLKNKFIDEQRYAIAFVRDKYRFNGWGRIKISMYLKQKGISEELIDRGLNEIDEVEYARNLKKLLRQKRRSITAGTDYERNGKLIKFALSRGYEMEEILRLIKQPETDDYMD